MTEKFVELENSRPGTPYEKVIKTIAMNGVCPFCPDQLSKYHKNPILSEGKFWKVTDNMWPYKATKHHILFILKDHLTEFSELSAEAWAELGELYKKEITARDIGGGTLMFRFGDTLYTGASVRHLHAHLIQSDPTHPEYQELKQMPGVVGRVG